MNINAANTVIDHLLYISALVDFDFINAEIEQTEDERAVEMLNFASLIVTTVSHDHPTVDRAEIAMLATLAIMTTGEISLLLTGEVVDFGVLEIEDELLNEPDEFDPRRTCRDIVNLLIDSGIAAGSANQLTIEGLVRNRINQIKYGNFPISVPDADILEAALDQEPDNVEVFH